MSDQVPTTSAQAEIAPEIKKKFVNAITQHGNEANADMENIVVLTKSFSPTREIDEPVQHEEFEYNDFLAAAGDDSDVSTKTLFLSRVMNIFFIINAARISCQRMYRISNYITTSIFPFVDNTFNRSQIPIIDLLC